MQTEPKSPAIKDGRYRPVGVLGVGTYGKVLECYDSKSNSPVAVKVARKEAAYRRCALKESHVLSNLSECEDVMDIHDSFEEDGHIYIVGEMLHKNMYEVLKDRSFVSIALEDVREVAKVVLRALRNLHNMGYMHCDIKPENVMLRNKSGDFSQTCMIDFGAVRKLSENAYFDIQSLWYRAPEVICGVKYTPKIDSWSVGCLLYELHTGSPLFPGESPQSQLSLIMNLCGQPSVEAMKSGANSASLDFSVGESEVRVEENVTGDAWIREQFIDLLTQLLQPDENRRLSCGDALNHPYFATVPNHSISNQSMIDPRYINASLCSSNGLSAVGSLSHQSVLGDQGAMNSPMFNMSFGSFATPTMAAPPRVSPTKSGPGPLPVGEMRANQCL